MMILGQITWVDIFVFLIFLGPQLLLQVGLIGTLLCFFQSLPFLVWRLPIDFIYEHLFASQTERTPFTQHASLFEDFVARCVRYSFAHIPARIGRVFFSEYVALPFLRFRMLRHGYLKSPIHWHEVQKPEDRLRGLFVISDESRQPDIIILYAHGGGFAMSSSHFYLEFFLVWISLLKSLGFRNPAIFGLEYTLVPDACYPTQLLQALAGYKYVLSILPDPSRIVVSGDSAGALIILSLLLHISRDATNKERVIQIPGMAVLISPWVTLVSSKDKDTASDYLSIERLHMYAQQYVGSKVAVDDPIASPGNCKDLERWERATPTQGFAIYLGAEEAFAPEIRDLIVLLRKSGAHVEVEDAKNVIHAWPVVSLFLSSASEERLKGLKWLSRTISERIR